MADGEKGNLPPVFFFFLFHNRFLGPNKKGLFTILKNSISKVKNIFCLLNVININF